MTPHAEKKESHRVTSTVKSTDTHSILTHGSYALSAAQILCWRRCATTSAAATQLLSAGCDGRYARRPSRVQLAATNPVLDKICDIHGHLINLGGIELLDVAQDPDVIVLYKVDGNTFAAKSARSSDAVDV